MKNNLKYGFFLGGALILTFLFYYFAHPISMFSIFSKATLWEILLCGGFMFFAISQNKNSVYDSGASFKIALITVTIGLFISSIFKSTFTIMLGEKLNPIYLEASKVDTYTIGPLIDSDPLETLEKAELREDKIDEEFSFTDYLSNIFALFIMFCIPFSVIMGFLSRQLLKFRKTKKPLTN